MSFIQGLVMTTSVSAMLFSLASCGGGGDDDAANPHGNGDGNGPTPTSLVMPGLSLGVQRQSPTTLMISSAEAANVARVVVLCGTDWENAVAYLVTPQADGTWHANVPAALDENVMFRLVLTDGNTVESSVAAASL